ncbi:magnesium transporter [Mycolicibacterium litorale]|nr:magnesium transporter [Mycolicibacterium litorale]
MLLLSRVTGLDVLRPDGRVIGRLADLTADLGDQSGPQLVQRLLVRRRRAEPLLTPWHRVVGFGPTQVVLADAAGESAEAAGVQALRRHEILLGRDVLDTQVVDVVGQRLARVADVVLARTPSGRVELVGVEVGFGGVLQRLKLGSLARRTGQDIIAWSDLHLTSERGHAVQLATPRAAVHHLDPRALAALVSQVDTESATEILATKVPGEAAEVVQATHPAVGERVLRAMPSTAAARILAAMPAEHAGRWRQRLEHAPTLLGRRFLRSRVWLEANPRHRSGPGS